MGFAGQLFDKEGEGQYTSGYVRSLQKNASGNVKKQIGNYPDDYKEIIHLTKFERDTFKNPKPPFRRPDYQSRLTTYEFVNVWPTNLTSMRVAYGDSNVLRCSVQLAYDRFFADFGYNDTHQVPINGEFLPSNPQLKSQTSKEITNTQLTGYEHLPIDYPGNPNNDYNFNGIQF